MTPARKQQLKRLREATEETLLGGAAKSVARILRVPVADIYLERNRRGTPKFPKVDWKRYDHRLGTTTDFALSVEIGCTEGAVWARRSGRKIPAYQGR